MSRKTTLSPTQSVTPEIVEDLTDDLPASKASEITLPEADEFASSEFIDPNARLPRLQALRGMTSEQCGYFVSVEEMTKAGWMDFDSIADQMSDYTYEISGETEQGLLLKSPRMLVCPRTSLLAFDRQASREAEQMVILGPWKREHKDDDNVGNCQMYECILLSADNRPLHSLPLSYVAKGANQASFSQEWQKLVQEVTTCHAIACGIAPRPKNAKFNALCVFAFSTGRELVGKKQQSFACRVTAHEVPNLENWKTYFVGYDPSMKKRIWDGLQPEMPLLVPSQNSDALVLPAFPEE